MAISTIDDSQRKAAKVVGFTYLLAMVTANFAEIYVPTRLIVSQDAAKTAANIIAHEQLFRLGIAADLITFATDVVLIAALYVVLKPVSRGLALVAAFWRLVETSIVVVALLNNFEVLRLLSGSAYLRVFEADRLQALARLSISKYGAAYQVGLLFFGLGSAVFAYLWFKSRYIPRGLAGWGVFSSLLVVTYVLAFIIFPNLPDKLELPSLIPMGIFELTMGFWLLFKDLRPSETMPK
jgi:hypothetical protein